MSDSLITKKAIAEALKQLARKKPFDKISIADITTSCGLNRQTFYYHFQDKYELLNWIYYNEVFLTVTDGITFENWHGKLCGLLMQMKEDQVFYRNTVKCDQDSFKDYLLSITAAIFADAVETLDVKRVLGEQDRKFISEFYAYGICGTILGWIRSGMKESPENVSSHLKFLANASEKLAYERYLEESRTDGQGLKGGLS